MNIRKKFIIEIFILSAVLGITSFIIINNTMSVEENFSFLNDTLIPHLTLLKDLRLQATNVFVSVLDFIVLNNNVLFEENSVDSPTVTTIAEIQRNKDQFNQLLELYQHKTLGTEFDVSTENISSKWRQFEILSDKLTDYKQRGISDVEFVHLKDELIDSKNELLQEIDSVLFLNENKVEQQSQAVSKLVNDTTLLVAFLVLSLVVTLILLRYYLYTSILIPISKIRNATHEIAQDKLDTKIHDVSKDEIGELYSDVNKMTQDLKSAREELVKNEKIAIVGTLTSRISHDIRNPLSIIQITLENLKILLGENNLAKTSFEKIERSIFRITHQIDDVLDFIREKPPEYTKAMILDVIADSLDSLHIPDNIKLDLPQNNVELVCDPKMIATVFTNLILNSIQSIDGDGVIKITLNETDDKLIINLEDSGSGIPSESLSKIFEPLFTTKQHGTGLGLSSVNSIVKSHGGTISVVSPPTIFTITLPKIQN